MIENKRQKQMSSVLLKEINDIFIKLHLNVIKGGMISISHIRITPDLLEARIYISFYQVQDKIMALQEIEARSADIKKILSSRIRTTFRRIPLLKFYEDDTIDQVFKMEELLKQIKK